MVTELAESTASGRSLRDLVTPLRVHLVILVAVAVFSFVVATRLYFFYDDWSVLATKYDGDVWSPHSGHWNTIPNLIFTGLRDLFGLNSFLPFAVPVTIAHLAFVHLMWRFMVRVGVQPWIATALSLALGFFGAGSENFLWAFQVGFIGAMAIMMAVILILLRDRLRTVDIVLVMVLSTIALAFSGTALPLLAIAALIGWQRHGFVRSLGLFAPAGLVYLVWYVLQGRFAPSIGRVDSIVDLLAVPVYGLKMLTDGLGRAFPIEMLGPLIVVVVVVWGIATWSRSSREQRPAYLLFLAAPLFALLTGYSRVNLGIETATSSRYLYFAIPMMLPLLALGLGAFTTALRVPLAAVVALVGLVGLYNAGGLVAAMLQKVEMSSYSHQRLSATLDLIGEGEDIDPNAWPDGRFAPDILVGDLEELAARGLIEAGPYNTQARLSAVITTGLDLRTAAPGTAACVRMDSDDPALALGAASFLVEAEHPTTLSLTLTAGNDSSDVRITEVGEGWTRVVVNAAHGAAIRIEEVGNDVDVCRG